MVSVPLHIENQNLFHLFILITLFYFYLLYMIILFFSASLCPDCSHVSKTYNFWSMCRTFWTLTVIPQLLLMAALQDVHQPGIGYLRRKWKDKGLSTWQRLTEVEKILAETLGHQLDFPQGSFSATMSTAVTVKIFILLVLQHKPTKP